ncbi:MAG: class I SAM-dependent methyltransferase [Rhodoplanes sp.]
MMSFAVLIQRCLMVSALNRKPLRSLSFVLGITTLSISSINRGGHPAGFTKTRRSFRPSENNRGGWLTFAGRNPEFHQTLTSPGSFLDIGTGVGWLAIEAAQLWPALKIIGVDVWEPSLQLARANIAISGMQNRITVRTQNIVDLDEKEAFTVVFLPAPFLPYEVAVTAIERAYRALVRGGWLIFGIFTSQPDPLGEALAALRIVRCGGYPWKTPEVEERLRGVGFEQIEIFAPGMGSIQVFGRKPAKSGCD